MGAPFLISSFSKPPYTKRKSNYPKTHQVDPLFKTFTSPSLPIRYYLNHLDWNVRPLIICPCFSFPSLFTLSHNSSMLQLYLIICCSQTGPVKISPSGGIIRPVTMHIVSLITFRLCQLYFCMSVTVKDCKLSEGWPLHYGQRQLKKKFKQIFKKKKY